MIQKKNQGVEHPISSKKPTSKVKFRAINKTLIIGDSIVKHINQPKIQRAARAQSTVLTNSGAKVEDVHTKMNETLQNENYDSIIIHVGTNNLVNEDAESAASKMKELIIDAKKQVKRVAVSSVIKRYDGRVQPNNLTKFNKLVRDMCIQDNLTFIRTGRVVEWLIA